MAPKDGCNPWRGPADSSQGRKIDKSSLFRIRGESCRNIHMVDINRINSTIHQAGHLNTVTHMLVLSAFEHQANHFQNKGEMIEREACLHSWKLNKTGTINTCFLDHGEILHQEQLSIRGVSDEVLQVHGVLPGCKEEEITWLLYENAHGISNRMCRNNKL
jgi:hypothetical protein